MFLFLRLVLAHFVGDFVLQPSEVYSARKKGFKGALIHYVFILISLSIFSSPYLQYTACLIIVILATIFHIIQDETKIKYFTSRKYNFIAFVIDQFLHILVLTPIMLFDFANKPPVAANKFLQFYNNTNLIILMIGYIVSIFTGAYIWEAFKLSFIKGQKAFDPVTVKYGMCERFAVTIAFTFSLFWILIFPLLFRMLNKKVSSYYDLVFNTFWAACIGLVVANSIGFI